MADETIVSPEVTATNVGDAIGSVAAIGSAVVSVVFPQSVALILGLNIFKQLWPKLYPSLIDLFKSGEPTPEQLEILNKEIQMLLNPSGFYADPTPAPVVQPDASSTPVS